MATNAPHIVQDFTSLFSYIVGLEAPYTATVSKENYSPCLKNVEMCADIIQERSTCWRATRYEHARDGTVKVEHEI